MSGYQIEVEATDTYLKWMCNYPTLSQAIEEVFGSCKNYTVISIILLKEKGKQDGQSY